MQLGLLKFLPATRNATPLTCAEVIMGISSWFLTVLLVFRYLWARSSLCRGRATAGCSQARRGGGVHCQLLHGFEARCFY